MLSCCTISLHLSGMSPTAMVTSMRERHTFPMFIGPDCVVGHSSAKRGGDLGPFGPGQMQAAFDEVSLMAERDLSFAD